MVLLNSICFEQDFIGVGNVMGSHSSMLRRSCHSLLPCLLPGHFCLKLFRKIKFEFSTPIQPNVELAGFKKIFGKILQTGFNKKCFAAVSWTTQKNVSFLQPRIRAFFIAEAKFSYCILFWANTSALLSHIPSQIRWPVGCYWIFPMRSTLLSFLICLVFSKHRASTISSSRTCFCNAIR